MLITGAPFLQIFLSLLRRIQHSAQVTRKGLLKLLLLFKRLLGRFVIVLQPKETSRSSRPTSKITERDTGSGTICSSEIPSSAHVFQLQPASNTWPRCPTPPEDILESTQRYLLGHDTAQESGGQSTNEGSLRVTISLSYLRNQELSEVFNSFYTIVPERTRRYFRGDVAPLQQTTFELLPMTTRFETRQLPLGWKAFLHPEGVLYFMYEPKRLYTDANLYDPRILEHVAKFTHQFDEYIRTREITLSAQINIVFDIVTSEDEIQCQYYLADHATRSIFWFDRFTIDWYTLPVWADVAGVTEMSHLHHAIEAQYWYHCFMFPHSFSLDQSHINELRGTLTWSITDVLTSTTSTVTYEVGELERMLVQVNDMRDNTECKDNVAAYSRLMNNFARDRFINFHGQPQARLDRNRSVYRASTQRSTHGLLIRLVSPIMFYAPVTYHRDLEDLRIDRLVYVGLWCTFMARMRDEWQSINLLATVILNANVAFLAIQSVDENSVTPARSAAQITSYLSVIASLGSIVIGLLLTRKNKGSKLGAVDAATFLNSFDTEISGGLGVDILATLYSVPYALLMWSIVFYLVGFLYICFNDSTGVVRGLVSGMWLVVALFVLWSVLTLSSWETGIKQPRNIFDTCRDTIRLVLNVRPVVERLRGPVRRTRETLRSLRASTATRFMV